MILGNQYLVFSTSNKKIGSLVENVKQQAWYGKTPLQGIGTLKPWARSMNNRNSDRAESHQHVVQQQYKQSNNTRTDTPASLPEKNKKKWFWIIIALVLAALIAWFIYNYDFSGYDPSEPDYYEVSDTDEMDSIYEAVESVLADEYEEADTNFNYEPY